MGMHKKCRKEMRIVSVKKSIKNLNTFERILWFISVVLVAGSYIIGKQSDYLTLCASLIGVTALTFVAKGDVLGQALTVIFSVFYGIISFRLRYYGEIITYLGMTAPIAIMSIITWLKNPYSDCEVKVNSLSAKCKACLSVATGIVTFVFYFILKACGNNSLEVSTISVATSFSASALMMLRSPYYAVAYALNDIVLIILWILASIGNTEYIPMVVCFGVFFINDIYGFINWGRMRKRQR